MFVSHKRGALRKPFQKPNILRRKSKVVKLNTLQSNESPEISYDMGSSNDNILTEPLPSVQQVERDYSQTLQQCFQTPKFVFGEIREMCEDNSHRLEINGDNITIYASPTTTESMQQTLNVESFLNDGVIKQTDVIFLEEPLNTMVKHEEQQKWTLNLMGDNSKDKVTLYDGSQTSNTSSVSSNVTNQVNCLNMSQDIITKTSQKNGLNCVNSSGAVKLKCDVPNCDKSFWTEARLQGHKNKHKNQKSTPTLIQCPVKRTGVDGTEEACGRTFGNRNQLLKHLNTEHSPEEALYSCNKCGRRFFYPAGARSHAVTSCTRAFLCAWAGCGRVFRQPCRLREHARAHTGDRPYACTYPECNWAFRSASKLMRHMRGHTGERRHECSACGRAFPRREHLRDHFARHHTQSKPCDVTEGQAANKAEIIGSVDEVIALGPDETYATKSISNFGSLLISPKDTKTKNGNKKQPAKRGARNTKTKNETVVISAEQKDTQNQKFIIEEKSIIEKEERVQNSVEDSGNSVVIQDHAIQEPSGHSVVIPEGEERCARTHCTWPLQRTQHYAIEDDTQVEQSESSESNIYTVRSDLFLHGNLLINEDSEWSMGRAECSSEGAREAAPLDPLGLIDAHPTIDLMQEELMYADAVDESSFRVLLLNGEELA